MPRKKEPRPKDKLIPLQNDLLTAEREFRKYLKKNLFEQVKKSKRGLIVAHCFSSLHPELKGVVLKVIATPSDWEKLGSFTHDHPYLFGHQFYSHFVQPAKLEIHEKNNPRGKQTKQIQRMANEIKIAAGKLYAFNRYWCKTPFIEWPGYMKRVIGIAKKEGHEDYLKPNIYKNEYVSKQLTAYIIDKVYGLSAERVGLKPLFEYQNRESTENFYITYIQGKKGLSKTNFQLIKSKTSQEVAQLIYTDPTLEYIFFSFHLDNL